VGICAALWGSVHLGSESQLQILLPLAEIAAMFQKGCGNLVRPVTRERMEPNPGVCEISG